MCEDDDINFDKLREECKRMEMMLIPDEESIPHIPKLFIKGKYYNLNN